MCDDEQADKGKIVEMLSQQGEKVELERPVEAKGRPLTVLPSRKCPLSARQVLAPMPEVQTNVLYGGDSHLARQKCFTADRCCMH